MRHNRNSRRSPVQADPDVGIIGGGVLLFLADWGLRVILTVIFFVVITPIGVIMRLTGSDPLQRRAPSARSYWKSYDARQRDTRHYEKML